MSLEGNVVSGPGRTGTEVRRCLSSGEAPGVTIFHSVWARAGSEVFLKEWAACHSRVHLVVGAVGQPLGQGLQDGLGCGPRSRLLVLHWGEQPHSRAASTEYVPRTKPCGRCLCKRLHPVRLRPGNSCRGGNGLEEAEPFPQDPRQQMGMAEEAAASLGSPRPWQGDWPVDGSRPVQHVCYLGQGKERNRITTTMGLQLLLFVVIIKWKLCLLGESALGCNRRCCPRMGRPGA